MRERRNIHRESIRRRKNFLPALFLTLILTLMTIVFVYFIDPGTFLSIPIFFLLSFFTGLFLFSIILGGSKRGIITSSGLVLFLLLRYLGIGNILNLLIITGLCIVSGYYFENKNK